MSNHPHGIRHGSARTTKRNIVLVTKLEDELPHLSDGRRSLDAQGGIGHSSTRKGSPRDLWGLSRRPHCRSSWDLENASNIGKRLLVAVHATGSEGLCARL